MKQIISQTLKKPELLPKKMSNSYNNNNKGIKLIIYNNRSNLKLSTLELSEILQNYESIMANKGRRVVYFYFLNHVAATGGQIILDINMPEGSTYSHLKWLSSKGYIEGHGKITSYKKGGPKPVLYALPGASKEQLARVILKIRKSNQPMYSLVTELTQLLWEDVVDMEIQFQKILWLSKKNGRGFHFLGIADLIAKELQTHGVKVLKNSWS